MQLNLNIAHAFPYYQTVLLSSALTELDKEILAIVGVYQPITAKHIASQLTFGKNFTYSRREINSRLFKILSTYLIQDDYFHWSLRNKDIEYTGHNEDPEKGYYRQDEDAVNLDSATKIKHFNGKELTIKFTKINSLKLNGPQAGVTYAYYRSPLALALRTKQVGDIAFLPDGLYEVIEIN